MIIPILVTVMICTTLLISVFHGVDIRIKKEYNHTFKDETSFQMAKEEAVSSTDIKELIKGKESKEVEDFVKDTMNVFDDYFAEEEEKKVNG